MRLVTSQKRNSQYVGRVWNHNTYTGKKTYVGKYAYHEPKKVNELEQTNAKCYRQQGKRGNQNIYW